MKHLLIVKSDATINGVEPTDLSEMKAGDLLVFTPDDNKVASSLPKKNFAIALGRGNNSPALVIPEVDVHTLQVRVTEPNEDDAVKFKAEVTIPEPKYGRDYTLVLTKKGVVFNERSNWTVTEFVPIGVDKTAEEIAKSLANQFQAMGDTGALPIKATADGAKVTVEGLIPGDAWTLTAGDALYGEEVTITEAEHACVDAAYIRHLASMCAADKGYQYTYRDGDTIYPGYPEPVEDKKYGMVTLRFATAKQFKYQGDEPVTQVVHIVAPEDNFDDVLALFDDGSSSDASGASTTSVDGGDDKVCIDSSTGE